MMKRKLIYLFIILFASQVFADIGKLIKNVMPTGTMSNISKSAIVNDQLAGHFVGGSVLIKTPPIEDLQLMNFQSPSCKIGGLPCGAQLDLRGGAFSFIKAAEMEKFLKDLVTGVGGYVALMAIKTICPQCENIMTYLEQIQRNMNQFNINSCDMATNIAQGLTSKMDKGEELTRQSAMVKNGTGSDMADIRKKSVADKADSTMGNKELENILIDNFNLVWRALDKKAAKSDGARSFKELLMSISGTIIGKKDENSKRSISLKKSLVTQELVEQFIGVKSGNSEIELYVCDEIDKCLNPKKTKIKLTSKDTLYGSIDEILISMVKKIKENKGQFTEEEESLISLSSIPLIPKIQRELANNAEGAYLTVRMSEFVEALCYDVVVTHLTKLLHEISEAVSELSYQQIADIGIFRQFEDDIHHTMSFLASARTNAFTRFNVIEHMKERMLQEEAYFEDRFSGFVKINIK